jgi:hypothetical protein
MTDNPYAPLLPWDESITESPDWKGGESSSILIYSNTTTQEQLTSLCKHASFCGYKYAETDNKVFADNRCLLTFIKPN